MKNNLSLTKAAFTASAVLFAFSFSSPCLAAGQYSLTESVEATLAFNPELKTTQEARQMSLHALEEAEAGRLPTISAYAGLGAGVKSDSVTRTYDENGELKGFGNAGLRLSQPLWHGGGIESAISMRKHLLNSADTQVFEKGEALAFDAIVAHTEVARRLGLVRLAEDNIKEHRSILSTVRNRYDNNIATEGELHQIESRLARAQATLASYQQAYQVAVANYLRVTGQEVTELSLPIAISLPYADVESARQACNDSNPRLRAANMETDAAGSERDMIRSQAYPRFDLEVGPSWSDRDSRGPTRDKEFDARVTMNWEIFNGGATRAAVSQVDAKIRQNRHYVEALRNMLHEDISGTYSLYHSSLEQIDRYSRAKKSSRLAKQDYYRQFVSAQRSLIDVLDAENDYFYAACQQLMAEGEQVMAAYRLLALGGNLLNGLGVRAPAPPTQGWPVY